MTRIISLSRGHAAVLAGCLLVGLVVIAAILLPADRGAATTSSPPPSATAPGEWKRYVAQDFTDPAGDLCRFRFRSHVLFDAEYVRTTATFHNGSPLRQEYVGPLVVRMTNKHTGVHIRRDLSGRAVLVYRRDGGYDFRIQGPAAVGFRPGDSLPRGYYVLRGYHVVRFAADGSRTMTVDRGSEHSLCIPLSSRTR